MADEVLLVLSSFPDRGRGATDCRETGGPAVTLPAPTSLPRSIRFYWWKGEIETASEMLVYFKTTATRFGAFRKSSVSCILTKFQRSWLSEWKLAQRITSPGWRQIVTPDPCQDFTSSPRVREILPRLVAKRRPVIRSPQPLRRGSEGGAFSYDHSRKRTGESRDAFRPARWLDYA